MKMKLPRVSLRDLMAFVLLIGVGLAALARPNNGWATLLSAFVLATLPASLLGVIFRDGSARAGWVGYAVFGWSFFVLAFYLNGSPNSPMSYDVRWTFVRLGQAMYAVASLDGKQPGTLLSTFGKEDSESRDRVAYSLMGLMFAALGGRIGRTLGRRESPARA